ncbi:MAG TPA: sigma 54-interacting transcriptional regulator [Pyrinomonadaceae bacterium]|jgi:transcriptional regulator with PAS, ATPase and Fis domain/tetratricopeptide (TPR) repeat protein|nr:sigma 54-interacting transcriptional regulator [Pyrinomonadaceae bacterium]
MDKRVGHGLLGRDQKSPTDRGVVDFSDARVRIRSRAKPSHESLMRELDEIRSLLDQGLSTEAKDRLAILISSARHNPSILALARCALSTALEQQGHYRDSLAAVAMYEDSDSRAKLDDETVSYLRVQIGLAYNYNGDHPKAIAMLQAALRDHAEKGVINLGHIYAALSRTYRTISEYPIARDYAQRALESFRQNGDWRGLAESYFGVGVADIHEGNYEECLENLEQALKLIGDRPAAYMLGKVYANMAGACWFLKRPQEGIDFLKKAITYYERTDHKTNAANGYNNLGINLILIGQWDRAQEALERALFLATEVDERGAKVPMILDSLGELHMLRGDLDQAKDYLGRAVTLANENGNKWYAGQALRTSGRCSLATDDPANALAKAKEALGLAELIGDRQGICESRLIAAEAHLRAKKLEDCNRELQHVTAETSDATADLNFTGEAHRLNGMLNMARGDAESAAQHFGSSVSIFDMLGDRYRAARAHLELGRAYAIIRPERAGEHLSRALNTFRDLGARIDLTRAEEELRELARATPERIQEQSALTQLLTLRLAEAVASRELLLRELAAVMRQETGAQRVIITERGERNEPKVVVALGCAPVESENIAVELDSIEDDSACARYCKKHDAEVILLKSSNAPEAKMYLSPRNRSKLPNGVSLEPLLRVVELGLDVCALRAGAQKSGASEHSDELTGTSLMPGFIHSSPAMTQLVEEVHKIRSSDVTVLVTGESGTGKELVARAIHAISSRRAKVFVPFNCTAVPKELSEGYLFGYRRGAFTGAVNDSHGVIRTAAGGTLFLDEIGDLPLDVQPKLLRFLQEGEIQPLGEQRPTKVDVRIIAATNTDLEEMVAQGRFREDLYYRLNVIRLRVPPLRERRSEIPTIVNYYVNHYSAKFGRKDIQITPQAVDLLMVSDWPGNVRQLCNEIQRTVARAEDGTVITPEQLSPELKRTSSPTTPSGAASITSLPPSNIQTTGTGTLAEALAEVERRMISDALRRHGGNISRAARELGLTRRGLYLKLERHELSVSA